MEFNPKNPIVQLCLRGIAMEEQGRADKALELFSQAWKEATCDLEWFLSAHFLARVQADVPEQVRWLETALEHALKVDSDTARSALPDLYSKIANRYQSLGETQKAKVTYDRAASVVRQPTDRGPFYHGTRADLRAGDLLVAGGVSNYRSALKMNHIYFTALINGAALAAGLAKGDQRERVYIVEPTGPFEDDPNVTNKKFPGNPTRSYRSEAPLRIIGEADGWDKLTPEEIQKWREQLARNKGEIIN